MTFLYPIMLAGLATLAAPILFHLIARQRYQVQDFPTLRLLQPDVRSNVFALRLVDSGQLLLRLLVLLLLVLAMARLFAPWAPAKAPCGRNLLVVLDCSASMRMRAKDPSTGRSATLVELAKARARQLLSAIGPPSQCALVAAAENATVLAPLRPDPAPALAALDGVDATDGGSGLVGAVAACCDMARSRREVRSQIVVLTDLRASAFDARDQLDLQRIREARDELGGQLDIVLVDLASGAADNVAIVEAHVRGQQPKVGDDAHVVARVANSSPGEKRIKLRLSLGNRGEPLARQITIAPGEQAEVDLTTRVNRAVRAFVEARIDEDDALPHDNAFSLPLDVADARRILIVKPAAEQPAGPALPGLGPEPGKPAGEPEAAVDGATILRFVLNPGRELGRAYGTGINTTAVTPEALAGQPLSKYDVIVLYDVSALPEQSLKDLDTFVRQGRALVFVCSGGTSAMRFNRSFASAGPERDVLSPVELGNDRALPSPVPVELAGTSHPLLAPFADRLKGDLSVVRFAAVREVRRLFEGAEVILRAGGGIPLAVERPLGQGRAMLLTFGFELDRGNIARTRVFPVLMWRVMDYLTGRLSSRPPDVLTALRPAALDVSESAFAFVDELELSRAADESASDFTPRRLPIAVNPRGRYAPPTGQVLVGGLPAGRYLLHKVQANGAAAAQTAYARCLAVNPDPRESEMARLPRDQVAGLCGEAARVVEAGEDAGLAIRGNELWTLLVALLILAYAAEAAVGWALSARRERQRATGGEP